MGATLQRRLAPFNIVRALAFAHFAGWYSKSFSLTLQSGGPRRALNSNWELRCAANLYQAVTVALHLPIVCQPGQHIPECPRRIWIRRFDNSVMHPGTLPPGADDSRSPHVREVPAYLWLICFEYFHEETDANLISSHQIQKA